MRNETIRLTTLLATLTALAAAPALADPRGAERVRDNAEIRQDHRQRRDDLRDLGRLESLAERFDAARDHGDAERLQRIDRELRAAATAELHESRGELAGDRAELRRDKREVRRDAPGAGRADDRRDLRDDRRDAAREARSLDRRREIASELRDLAGRYDEPALDRKRGLLGELITIARAETVANGSELREDRRERREDRGGGY